MESRPLGRSGLLVSAVGFGGMPIAGGFYGETDDAESLAALARALELGCTLFDTADVYGNGRSERLIGAAIAGRLPSDAPIVVATKAGLASPDGHRPEKLLLSFQASRARLGVGAIGLFLLHDPPRAAIADEAVLDLLRRLKAEGRARAIGVSVVSPEDGLAALDAGAYDAIEVEANLLRPEPLRTLAPRAAERSVAILVKVPLDHGILSGKYGASARFGPGDFRAHAPREELAWRARAVADLAFLWKEGRGRTPAQAALRYLLDAEGVTAVLPGAKTKAQAEEAMAASRVPPLSPEERERVRELQRRGWK